MNRREFLRWVGVGGIASSLPIAIAACSDTKEAVSSPPAGEFTPIGTVAELDQKGQILNKDFSGSPVLIVRDPNNSKTISAVNPTCTHKGCSVVWKAEEKNFVCPCHGAKFAIDGKIVKEPASKPLATYQAKIEGDSILVKKA